MSLLSVSTISNPSAGSPNILLNADGSVTLPVVSGAAPAQFQAGTLWFDTAGPTLNIRNAANTGWLPVGGGGGGTVTGVTGTLPIVSTGGVAPVLSINAATTSLPGSVQLADGTASKAGTSTTLVNTPAFSVPKDAANMTGAAILPSGTNAQRTAITGLTAGMTRFNTDYTPDSLEVYNGTAWKQLAYVPSPTLPADLTISANTTLTNSTYVVNNLTVAAGATVTGVSQNLVFVCYGEVNILGSIVLDAQGPRGGATFAGTSGEQSAIQAGFNVGGGVGTSSNLPYSPLASTLGSGGASGFALTGVGGQALIAGGNGGGGIIIRTFKNATVSGTLSARGGTGSGSITPPALISGGGGGSGGSVIVHATGDINFSGAIDVSGAAGLGGAVNGVGVAANGGGGGSGGYVILEAEGTLTDTGTKNLSGGAAGITSGTPDVGPGGGGGGSFGGLAGDGAFGPGAIAGQSGKFELSGSPI